MAGRICTGNRIEILVYAFPISIKEIISLEEIDHRQKERSKEVELSVLDSRSSYFAVYVRSNSLKM